MDDSVICVACHKGGQGDIICPACAALCKRARDGFVDTPEVHGARAFGVASTSIEEHCQDWPTYNAERKEACRPRFVAALEKVLDIQADVIKSYAQDRELTLTNIHREITSVAAKRRLAGDLLDELRPGDHIVLFGHAGGVHLSSHPITATSTFAVRCAERGVRLHIASLGLDMANPLAQYSLRLAQDALLYWNTRQIVDRFAGGISVEESENNLFGLVDNLARWDARVRWVVRGVRNGISPAELAERGQLLYMATVLPKRGTKFALTINARRGDAIECVCSARFLCLECGVTIMAAGVNCHKCGGKPLPLGKGTVSKGVKFSEFSDIPIDRQLLACWDFHRRINPGQDKERPWELAKSA